MAVQKKLLPPPDSQKIYDKFVKGKNVILNHGDSYEFLKTVPDNIIKLVVTSPPYNLGKVYEDKVSLDEYLADQEVVIGELVRVLSDDGSICWEVGNYVNKGEVFPLDIYFYEIFKKHNLK